MAVENCSSDNISLFINNTGQNYICGDADGSEGIDILDVVYIINHKYNDGPAPGPLESADVDGTQGINILDVVYLINFKYKDGPDPVCP